MKDILRRFYPYQFQYESTISGYTAFQEADGWVLVLPGDYIDENEITEQYVIADFIQKSGFPHMAVPVQSVSESYRVPINKEEHVYVCQLQPVQAPKDYNELIHFLERFHNTSRSFPYSPIYVNRYGHWKKNWEQIVDQFDFVKQSYLEKDELTDMERLWLESCFYFIGIGENAIQYLQETNHEKQYNQYDQPVFAFERILPFPNTEAILPNRIVYDHPSRDLAELTRHIILTQGRDGLSTIGNMLTAYNQKRPLSLFSWRLFYARLIFPIHFVDYSTEIISQLKDNDYEYRRLKAFFSYQNEYEYCLKQIHQYINRNVDHTLPSLDWLETIK
ncbi:hypothetical protein [Salirhabdus sp. Marseille-P4669]|uniref:hypothetical protein n=1 Tax=Salirhabdus sp. Marseille-P4669 TaxID=2042310 RepID=UPI000C7CCA14|nr:hypothetical protein [Salirhabdus sp. Marseille-P4669]